MKKRNDRLLISIPFAGGSIYSLAGLAENLKGVDICSLELPGRGRRINEPLLKNIDDVLQDMYNKVTPVLHQYRHYYIFGHSLGALVGYRFIRKLLKNEWPAPAHFFVSGTGGPSGQNNKEGYHLLPSQAFRDMLRDLGGCPAEVLENELLMDFFEPIIRADFEILETIHYEDCGPADIPITGFFGSEEETVLSDMQLWQNESTLQMEIIQLQGNHFFIFNQWKVIADTISKTIGLL